MQSLPDVITIRCRWFQIQKRHPLDQLFRGQDRKHFTVYIQFSGSERQPISQPQQRVFDQLASGSPISFLMSSGLSFDSFKACSAIMSMMAESSVPR